MQKNRRMKISVIVPVHNRHTLFLRLLNSILCQKVVNKDVEIIIIDDGSTPSIRKFLNGKRKKYINKIILVRNQKSQGPSVSRNMGLRRSSGDLIAFVDSDDYCYPEFLEKVSKRLDENRSEISMSLLKPVFVDQFSLVTRFFYTLLSVVRTVCFSTLFLINRGKLDPSFFYMTRLSSMIYTKKSIGRVKFSKSFKLVEDWKFLLDCIKSNNPTMNIIPNFLVGFTYQKNSETFTNTGSGSYYNQLLKQIPHRMKKNLGIKMFNAYTSFYLWKEKQQIRSL